MILGILGAFVFPSAYPSARATDPMRTAIIVNADSTDSLTIANHYAAMRGIPDRCIVMLDKVPKEMICDIETLRSDVLNPALNELNQRGLANQVDVIAYSADFPTAIKLDTDFAKVPPRHHLFTPVGSINGLTTLYQLLGDNNITYVLPRANFYARADVETLRQNPFLGDVDRKAFDDAVAAANDLRFDEAIRLLEPLAKKHRGQWPLRFRIAGYQVRGGKIDDALETISMLLRDRFAYRLMFDAEPDFDAVRKRDLFVKLLAAMPAIMPNRIPPVPFSGRVSYSPNGLPLDDATGPRYLLSMVLAVTKGQGTTLKQGIEILRRAVDADGTGQPATFFFSNSEDVRATTRFPLMPLAAVTLKQLGHKVIISKDRLPTDEQKLMGVMLGSANYDWSATTNTMLPGAIVDNLTSLSGMLHEPNSQTPMTESLLGGAAATSGTVTEPYALQFKFPTALMYAYYAGGTTLAEAFYLSVESPYQLLIVGDPLCRPYGSQHISDFTLEDVKSLKDTFTMRVKFSDPMPTVIAKVSRLDMYFGGRLALSSKPVADVRVNTAGLPRGWHEVTLVAVSNHPLQMSSLASTYVLIGVPEDCPTLRATLNASNDSVTASIDIKNATQIAIEHQGRRIVETDPIASDINIPVQKVGYGPVRLTPLAKIDDVWISGKPIIIDIPLPPKVIKSR